MVVIRLTRIGKKKQAFYRVVVADSKRFVNSKFIEIIGWYNPKTKEASIKTDRVAEWFAKGAQPSNTVAKLLKANGVKLPDYVVITEKVSKPKKEPVVKEPKVETPAEVPVEEVVETVETEEPKEEVAPTVEGPVEIVEVMPDSPEIPAEAITEEEADKVEEDAKEAEEKSETE